MRPNLIIYKDSLGIYFERVGFSFLTFQCIREGNSFCFCYLDILKFAAFTVITENSEIVRRFL